MFRRHLLRRFVCFALVVALAFLAAPAHALPFFWKGSSPDLRQGGQIQKEEIGFFTFLFRLFGKSRGGMDPNGITEPVPTGAE
jgi:hypothetical protein